MLRRDAFAIAERQDAALLLALIGADQPLRECLANGQAPVAPRRRAAECLGLLASRCGDPERRRARELEGWLRSEALDGRRGLRSLPRIKLIKVKTVPRGSGR